MGIELDIEPYLFLCCIQAVIINNKYNRYSSISRERRIRISGINIINRIVSIAVSLHIDIFVITFGLVVIRY